MKRFYKLFNWLSFIDLLIDIGCDHGYFGIHLLNLNKVNAVWNVDINQQPLNSAVFNYSKKYLNKAKFFLSDGFNNVPVVSQKATVVISGMGTNAILKILSKLPTNINQLILSSNTHHYPLRKWAIENNWFPEYEEYSNENNVIYKILVLSKNNKYQYINDQEILIGKLNLLDEESLKNSHLYWKNELLRINKILANHFSDKHKWILKTLKQIPIFNLHTK